MKTRLRHAFPRPFNIATMSFNDVPVSGSQQPNTRNPSVASYSKSGNDSRTSLSMVTSPMVAFSPADDTSVHHHSLRPSRSPHSSSPHGESRYPLTVPNPRLFAQEYYTSKLHTLIEPYLGDRRGGRDWLSVDRTLLHVLTGTKRRELTYQESLKYLQPIWNLELPSTDKYASQFVAARSGLYNAWYTSCYTWES